MIENHAFLENYGLESIAFNEGLQSIGFGTFRDCFMLKNLALPESLLEIGDWAFAHSASLQDLVIPPNVQQIGEAAFHSCGALTSIDFPEGLQRIGARALGSWLHTSEATYPYQYRFGENAGWFWYVSHDNSFSGERWFYDFSIGEFVFEGVTAS